MQNWINKSNLRLSRLDVCQRSLDFKSIDEERNCAQKYLKQFFFFNPLTIDLLIYLSKC